jgi:hypothetical protein
MRIRIRLRPGRPFRRRLQDNRELALALGALLTPASLMAYVLGFWRLASDIGVVGEFGISGFFSHWQIWIPLAVLLQFGGHALERYGRDGTLQVPKPLLFLTFPEHSRKDRRAALSRLKMDSR